MCNYLQRARWANSPSIVVSPSPAYRPSCPCLVLRCAGFRPLQLQWGPVGVVFRCGGGPLPCNFLIKFQSSKRACVPRLESSYVFSLRFFFLPALSDEVGRPVLRSVRSLGEPFPLESSLSYGAAWDAGCASPPCHSHQGLYWSSL